ncbi:9542_t:CDS:2, partial [Acaulospora colombiana]
ASPEGGHQGLAIPSDPSCIMLGSCSAKTLLITLFFPYKRIAVLAFVSSPIIGTASLCYLTIKGLQTILSKDVHVHSYPPGPPRKPILGALTSFPKDHIYERFNEWAALY